MATRRKACPRVPRACDIRGTHARAGGTALGSLLEFELLRGHLLESLGVAPLIEGVAFGGLSADRAFDVDWILDELDVRGAQGVISEHPCCS